jgi:acyl-CoA synthetase (AMP-forming)/AMP-acid ligase II
VTEQVLRMYLLDRLVQFKIPRKIDFVDTVPRTPTGKPLRHAGTEMYSKSRPVPPDVAESPQDSAGIQVPKTRVEIP